jgi:hypothetical protein
VPEAEIAKVRGRLRHYDALCFAQKYSISLDWLICGEVKGLIRTIVASKLGPLKECEAGAQTASIRSGKMPDRKFNLTVLTVMSI